MGMHEVVGKAAKRGGLTDDWKSSRWPCGPSPVINHLQSFHSFRSAPFCYRLIFFAHLIDVSLIHATFHGPKQLISWR